MHLVDPGDRGNGWNRGNTARRPARNGRVQLDRHARDSGLPVFGREVLRVELVAGRSVADRADDAAVVRVDARGAAVRRVLVDTPVDGAAEADDREDADVDPGTLDRRRRRLVVGLVGDPGRVVDVAVGLHDDPLTDRVAALEVVVAARVGACRALATVVEVVLAVAQRQREPRHTELALARIRTLVVVRVIPVHPAVAVGVVEDVAAVFGPPAVQGQLAHLHDLAVRDGDVDEVEVVVLWLVPPGQRVVAGGHAGDVELALRVAAAHPDGHVAGLEVHQREPRLHDRTANLGSGVSSPEVEGAARGRGVCLDPHHCPLDVSGRCAGEWLAVVERLHEAEDRQGHELSTPRKGLVEAGVALHDPGVVVVVALEGRCLDPGLPVRWGHGHRVAVGAQVRNREHPARVADAFPTASRDGNRQHVVVELRRTGSHRCPPCSDRCRRPRPGTGCTAGLP